jgi:hypothetical protein
MGPLASGGAEAQTKKLPRDKSDLDRVVRLLQDVGYRAAPDTAASTPTVHSKFNGVNSRIQLANCGTDGKACTLMLFHAGFDTPDGVDMKIINDWNADKFFGRAYLDNEKDPHIDLASSLVGVTDENIKDIIERWDLVIAEFSKAIGW